MGLIDTLIPFGTRRSLEDFGLYVLPQVVPPRNATLLDQKVTPIVAATSALIAFSYRVPSNRRGTLRRLAVDTADPAAIPSITFSVLRSNAPVPNYQLVQAPIGTIGEPDEVGVVFDGDQLMQIQVANAAAFAYEVHVRVVAHFWDVIETWGR